MRRVFCFHFESGVKFFCSTIRNETLFRKMVPEQFIVEGKHTFTRREAENENKRRHN